MKPKIILDLALVLIGVLFGCSTTARADETNMPVLTNAAQSYVTATVKTNWMDTKVTLYRTAGGVVQLDAKREVVTVRYGPHTNDVDVVAFVDSDTGNAWVGSSFGFAAIFYLETESGIVRGNVLFSRLELGAPRPNEHDVINGALAFGEVIWNRSFVPSVKRGENVDAAIVQFNKNIDLKSVDSGMREERRTILANSRAGVETGLNPWLFQDEGHGSQFVETTIEAVDVSNGKLRLDLKSPTGSHKASVWIDLKTWKVVKAIQDGKSSSQSFAGSEGVAGGPYEAFWLSNGAPGEYEKLVLTRRPLAELPSLSLPTNQPVLDCDAVKNPSEAYKWLTLAAQQGEPKAALVRDRFSQDLSPEAIAEGFRQAKAFTPHPKDFPQEPQ